MKGETKETGIYNSSFCSDEESQTADHQTPSVLSTERQIPYTDEEHQNSLPQLNEMSNKLTENSISHHKDAHEKDPREESDSEDDSESILTFLNSYIQKNDKLKNIFYYQNKSLYDRLLPYSVLCVFVAYLIAVIVIKSDIQKTAFWCSGDGILYIITLIVLIFVIYSKIKKQFGKQIKRSLQPLDNSLTKLWMLWYIKLSFFVVILAGVLAFLVIDSKDERRRLVSIVGLVFILLFAFVFSNAPRKVRWRHVIWAVTFQFLLGLFALRWKLGNSILQCIADKVEVFLSFATEGAAFVFGDELSKDVFAFSVLPVTLYFSFFTSILYYYGIVQWVVIKLGWLFQITIGTTLCESMNASASIFLGMTESPLLIKPYIGKMTRSELHAVMTGGFATIAGSLLAAYISLGVKAELLLTACVMNAPAALGISKLFYPETRKTRIDATVVAAVKSEEINVLHAGCVGVSNALPLVANIAGNLIAFIAFIGLFNNVFDWSCQLVNFEEDTCSLEGVFGYIFMPLSFLMGVEWDECYYVGQLIGLKIIVNEFVAYTQLSEFVNDGLLSPRSEYIATFALCGFSNISSMGIMMGGLGPMAPERKDDMARVLVRAMIAGSMATFSSACIAGALMSENMFENNLNTTMTTALPTLSS